jgi:hypothetical protein
MGRKVHHPCVRGPWGSMSCAARAVPRKGGCSRPSPTPSRSAGSSDIWAYGALRCPAHLHAIPPGSRSRSGSTPTRSPRAGFGRVAASAGPRDPLSTSYTPWRNPHAQDRPTRGADLAGTRTRPRARNARRSRLPHRGQPSRAPWGQFGLDQAFERVLHRAGLDGWSIYCRRHYAITSWLRAGKRNLFVYRF